MKRKFPNAWGYAKKILVFGLLALILRSWLTKLSKKPDNKIPICAGAGAVSLNLNENRATVLVSKSCLRTRIHTSGCGQLKAELPRDKNAQYYVAKGNALIGPVSSDQQADHQFNFGDDDFYIAGYDGIAKLRFLASEKSN